MYMDNAVLILLELKKGQNLASCIFISFLPISAQALRELSESNGKKECNWSFLSMQCDVPFHQLHASTAGRCSPRASRSPNCRLSNRLCDRMLRSATAIERNHHKYVGTTIAEDIARA